MTRAVNPPVAGIDGCRGGWIVVTPTGAQVVAQFVDALAMLPSDCVIAIDMPIGLLDAHVPGGRTCDQAARALLGRARAASVFSPPPRPALGARTLPDAQATGARITLQTLNIMPKIAEVDAAMTPALQRRVHETHPELAFTAMNGDQPVVANKKTPEGRAARIALLERAGVLIPPRQAGAAIDDLLDACALVWSAHRIARGAQRVVPDGPAERDAHGLRMEINW